MLHRETYRDAERSAAVDDYDAVMATFYAEQGMSAAGSRWSHHSAQRVATVEALRGRHTLERHLGERRFGLK